MDSPQDYPSEIPSYSNKQLPSQNVPVKVLNNQTINNKFSKLPYQITGQYVSINALSPIPHTPYPSHPISVTPNAMNQQPLIINTLSNYDNVPVTHTSVPLSNRFTNLDRIHMKSKTLLRKTQLNTENTGNFGVKNEKFKKHISNWGNKMDLRQLLSSKKKKPESSCILNKEKINKYHLISSDNDDDDEDDDDMCLTANLKTNKSSESLDISSLKKLLRIEDNFKVWYIVIDSNIMLNNINFLKMLVNSDSQCRLMVPQTVMEKIQMATTSRLRTQAHRAAYYISQQVDENVAIIDNAVIKYNDERDAIRNCCFKLVDEGYNMVLLTDDIELHNTENTSRFLVITVREIKKILINTVTCDIAQSQSHDAVCSSPKEEILDNDRSIKITISNNVNNDTTLSSEAFIDDENITDMGTPEYIPVEHFVPTILVPKNTDDVAVQANLIELDALHINTDQIENIALNNDVEQLSKAERGTLKCTTSADIELSDDIPIKNSNSMHRPKSSLSNVLSDCDQTDVGTMTKVSCRSNYQRSCSDLSKGSIDSLRHYNQDSNDSSSVKQKKSSDNLVINETPLETSNVHCFSVKENYQRIAKGNTNFVKEQCVFKSNGNGDKNVMFEVTSSAMEDILKMKCDEWISRFVQIIEEASSQVLQQDPPFILDTMLPPWTIYEATECIKRKFADDNDIVDAANKLLNVLFEIGGLRGKIKLDITPAKYMEMYSYGVYLIDALQGLLSTSEDVQIAGESLSKLLADIQDSHLNPGNQDSFNDGLLEHTVNETEEKKVKDTELVDNTIYDEACYVNNCKIENIYKCSNTDPAKSIRSGSSPVNSNLRSQRKKMLQEKEELTEKVNFIRNIDLDSSFFTNLNLVKVKVTNVDVKTVDGTKVIESGNEIINPESREVDNANTEKKIENASNTDDKINDTTLEKDIVTNEPKIIRNFTKCLEFENISNLVNDSWTSKNENYQKSMECTENEQNNLTNDFPEDEYCYGDDSEHEQETIDAEEVSEENDLDKDTEENVITIMENNIKFKAVLQKIQNHIKETFSYVHGFCKKCYKTLSTDGGCVEKNDIQHLAEKTHSYLNDLCDTLASILTREASDSVTKMHKIFAKEYTDIVIEDGDLEGYRNFITQCLEQGNILKDSVKLIIEAARD